MPLFLHMPLSYCHCGVAGGQWWVNTGVFYLQDPRWSALAQSPWVESLFQRNLCLAETSGCEWGSGEEVGLEHSLASPNSCCASVLVSLYTPHIHIRELLWGLSPRLQGREEWLVRLSGHGPASWSDVVIHSHLCATETKWFSSSGASPLLPVCSNKIGNWDRKLVYASRSCWQLLPAFQVSSPWEQWSGRGDRPGLKMWISPSFTSSPVLGWVGSCKRLWVQDAKCSVWVLYPAAHFPWIWRNILAPRLPCLLSNLVGFDQRV